MDTLALVQGTAEWRQARCGSLGASSVHEALAKTRTGWGASRANVQARLLVERLTGIPQDTYSNAAMQHGIDTEPEARAAYQFETGVLVGKVGLFKHPSIVGTHASPDGTVGDDGLVEIKCPSTATHIETLLGETIPSKYIIQCQWQMACTGRQWCDWASYDNRLPESMQLFKKRISRDMRHIAELETQVIAFLSELDAKLAALTSRYGIPQKEAA
jgi:putative phage-type endonuclease